MKTNSKGSEQYKCDPNNRVITRIWTSENNKDVKGEGVGHVSIETTTPHKYMSLWPTRQGKDSGNGFFQGVEHQFKSYAGDIKAEGDRLPELTYCLYSLNSAKITDQFTKIQNDPEFKGWALLGDNILLNRGNAHSCSSLAYVLLKAGGIYDLISAAYSSNYSSVVSPDGLIKAMEEAKKIELSRYPETEEFSFNGEKAVSPPSIKGRCSIQ